MPVIDPGQGRWMTDTTPVIAWLEGQQDKQTVYPGDPVLNFIALLIEDYADEWLWRPAMHYRWSFRPDRRHASETLHNEQLRDFLPIPAWAGRALLTYRQLFGFVRGDGVTRQTRGHVESTYHAALGRMQAILVRRPYLLGDAPTIADFGMMGPMFRHFGQDPTPSEIMRETAPAVFEWVARMWNAKPSQEGAGLIAQPDEPLVALLTEACETHLEQLRQNALAFSSGLGCFVPPSPGFALSGLVPGKAARTLGAPGGSRSGLPQGSARHANGQRAVGRLSVCAFRL
jgi:glutathione S-transferase